MTTKRLIDVSHTVDHGMVTYKGFPAPVIYVPSEGSRFFAVPVRLEAFGTFPLAPSSRCDGTGDARE